MKADEFVRVGVAIVLFVLLTPLDIRGQELFWTGQVRSRYEVRDPKSPTEGADDFVAMRIRFGIDAQIEDGLSIFIQPQDVRYWGEESHPLFDYSADHLDLHQGYVRLQREASSWLTTTVGRMETNFGGQRLVGAVDWTSQGQAFDGVRFDIDAGSSQWAIVGYSVNEETAAGIDEDEEFYATYGTFSEVGPGALDVYWLYDRIRGPTTSDEHLVGARYSFTGPVNGRLEGTLGTGSRADVDVAAFMLGARIGTSFAEGRLSTSLWYDYLSGDDPGTPESEVFNTFFGTNHKFYGYADLFLNMPAHTGGRGLQDLAMKLLWRPSAALNVGLDAHSFRVAEGSGLSGSHLGEEFDLTLNHRYLDHLGATLGLSYIVQDEPFSQIGRLDENLMWFYLMLNATF